MSRVKSVFRSRRANKTVKKNLMQNLKNLREKLAANKTNRNKRAAKPPLAPRGPPRAFPKGPSEPVEYRANPRPAVPIQTQKNIMSPAVVSKLGLDQRFVSQRRFNAMTQEERQIHINLLLNMGYTVDRIEEYYNVTLDGW
jgi:hypothetical protein